MDISMILYEQTGTFV